MPIMIADRTLRETAGGAPTETALKHGTVVEVLDDSTLPWTKIRVKETGQEGWTTDGAIDKASDALGPLSREEVAWECVDLADAFDINAFYLMAVAQLRSNVTGAATDDGSCFGPIGFSRQEWSLNAVQPEWKIEFSPDHITRWRAQMMVFAAMASTRQRALADTLSRQPSMAELLLAQILGTEAAALAIATPATGLADMLDMARRAAASEKIDPANLDGRDKPLLARDGKTSLGLIADHLQAALEASRGQVRQEVDKMIAKIEEHFGPALPVAGINLNSPHIPASRRAIASLIAEAFAAAGFGAFQQIAAIANAIAESGLNPAAENVNGERSFGLFQLNQNGGVGTGFPAAELKDPKRNIAIMLAEIGKPHQKAHRQRFMATTSLLEAVETFVFHFEKPGDKAGETTKRFKIAQTLVP